MLGKLSPKLQERMRQLSSSFCLVASERARWVISNSTGATRESSARGLVLGEKHCGFRQGLLGARRFLKSKVEELAGDVWGEDRIGAPTVAITGL